MSDLIRFQERLTTYGGRNLRGEPNLKVSFAPDLKKHNGRYKYPNPFNMNESMNCYVVEIYVPGWWFGEPEKWNTEVMGAYPFEGMYVLKTPLMTGDGKKLPLTESTFDAFRQKQLADIQWAEQTAKQRLEFLEADEARRLAEQQAQAEKEVTDMLEHWDTHQLALDNADNRVWSMPKKYDVARKGAKLPVRSDK